MNDILLKALGSMAIGYEIYLATNNIHFATASFLFIWVIK